MLSSRTLWILSAILSLTFAVLLVLTWQAATQQKLPGNQLVSEGDIDKALNEYAKRADIPDSDSIYRIPTGFYLQSLDFKDATSVHVAGYIWQRFQQRLPKKFTKWADSCKQDDTPFIFPEQIKSEAGIEPELRYEVAGDTGRVCGWYFEVTLRQPFDYRKYPFDTETVWLRMWTRDLLPNVVLVPDLASYPHGTHGDTIFGIGQRMVLGSWLKSNTYFSYTTTPFDTTFGILETDVLSEAPELNFNFVLKRQLVDAMVEHLLGILVIMILLFATMLVVSRDERKAQRHGFNTAMVLGACSALFFVVLISHIQLRAQFSGTNVVYLEMYYYLLYLLLMGATINTYYFSEEANRATSILHFRDNLIPKLLYWPFIFAFALCISVIMLL